MNGQLPRLLTVGEVAVYLRLSRAQVYNLIAQKKLPCIRLSERRIVVSEPDLLEWLTRQKGMEPGQLVYMIDRLLKDDGR